MCRLHEQPSRDRMDPLNFLTHEELTEIFHCKKTEISCMEEPNTFLNQLRDHNLVPENLYKKVIKMKCKDRKQEGVYEILDWLGTERGQCMRLFWTCVFKDHILKKYPVLRFIQNSLQEDSFRIDTQLPDAKEVKKKEKNSIQDKENTDNRQSGRLKRKKSGEGTEKLEQPGPSSFSKPNQEKSSAQKPTFTTPLRKGEKANIWLWNFYKTQLPVTCGDKDGTLYRQNLAKGCRSILYKGRWFTAQEFQRFAGKGNGKNWRQNILCQNTPLQQLIEEGHLQPPSTKKRCHQKNRKIQLPVSSLEVPEPKHRRALRPASSVQMERFMEDHEEEQNIKQHEEEKDDAGRVDYSKSKIFALPISCGSFRGILYKSRFAGAHSKSIRTDERWLTPEEFVQQNVTLKDGHWEKDILYQGKTLEYLVKKEILCVHPLLCQCHRCRPDVPHNDDVCCICNFGGDLVCCDECPRAFHHQCHLPLLEDRILGDNWMCTFCVLKINQCLWIPMTNEDVLNSPVSGNIMRCEYLLLCLYKDDALRVFTEDPTAAVRGYTSVIPRPMWLDQVKTRLQSKQYNTLREFVGDVRLIFQNCHIFNRDNEFGKMGARLSEMFEREFRTVFKIE